MIMMKEGKVFNQGAPDVVLTYDQIEEVYNTVVVVKTNPISGKPVVFPISERKLKEFKKSKE